MSQSTREKIQNTAEQLFAADGFDRVTLRQIARAADQRNVAAVQYHFGSKKGLLEAIVESHREQIDLRREMLLAEQAESDQQDPLGSLLEILILPLVEKLDSASGRAYLRIQAEGLSHTQMRPATRALTQRIGRQLGDLEPEGGAGEPSKPKRPAERLPSKHRDSFTILLLFHALADRARIEEEAKASRGDRKAFVESLSRAIAGVLRA